jgi:hypothetical protein
LTEQGQDAPPVRCRAGRRCADGENVHDETGDLTDRLGSVIDGGALCVGCVRAAEQALRGLQDDILELSKLLQPSSARQAFRDPDMPPQTRTKKPAPLPFSENVYTLIELIDYESTLWAESVADHDGVDWDSYAAEHSRRGDRVGRSSALLGHRLATLVALPVQQHRAHSLSVDPSDGHDPDTTTRYRGDYWANRPGWEGALRFIDLHERAARYIGNRALDHIEVPCPRCDARRLYREHHNGRVMCRACETPMSDDDYDAFIEHALEAHGSTADVVSRKEAARIAGVKPGTIRKWVQRGYLRPLPSGGYRRVAIEEFLAERDTLEQEAS